MKFKNFQFTPKNRRGMSSIVGGLIFVVLMVSAFTMFGKVLDTQDNLSEVARVVASADLQKQQESFKIIVFTENPVGPQAELRVQVNNNGQNSVEIFTVIVAEITDVANGNPVNVYDIPADLSFITPGQQKDILPDDLIFLDLAGVGLEELYTIKIISSLGTIKTYTILCNDTECGDTGTPAGSGSLSESLFLNGPLGINTKASTVIMFVTNTSDEIVTDVQPFKGFAGNDDCDTNDFWQVDISGVTVDDGITEAITNCTVTPIGSVTLGGHEVVIFKWDFTAGGDIGAVFTFCNSVIGTDPIPDPITSLPESCDTLEMIDPDDCGGCGPPDGDGDEDILDEKFITRPELFLTIPSPFGGHTFAGDDEDRALWGANVVNPTDTTMFIHKITITAFPPASNDNFDVIMEGGSAGHDCLPQDISPGVGNVPSPLPDFPPAPNRADEAGSWSCPGSNTIMWRDYDNPITLPPQSTYPFLVKLVSDDPITKNAESVLVDSTVYTTSGTFGKGNYQTTTYEVGMYANIFATSDWMDPLNLDKVISSVADIPSGSEQTFHVVLTDFDTDFGTYINANSKVVVNVPRAFTLVDTVMTESSGFIVADNGDPELDEPSIVIHPDNTTQIIATLENHLGDSADEVAILSFKATAPIVSEEKLMVMYTLANGVGTNDNSIGPLTEIILVVVP